MGVRRISDPSHLSHMSAAAIDGGTRRRSDGDDLTSLKSFLCVCAGDASAHASLHDSTSSNWRKPPRAGGNAGSLSPSRLFIGDPHQSSPHTLGSQPTSPTMCRRSVCTTAPTSPQFSLKDAQAGAALPPRLAAELSTLQGALNAGVMPLSTCPPSLLPSQAAALASHGVLPAPPASFKQLVQSSRSRRSSGECSAADSLASDGSTATHTTGRTRRHSRELSVASDGSTATHTTGRSRHRSRELSADGDSFTKRAAALAHHPPGATSQYAVASGSSPLPQRMGASTQPRTTQQAQPSPPNLRPASTGPLAPLTPGRPRVMIRADSDNSGISESVPSHVVCADGSHTKTPRSSRPGSAIRPGSASRKKLYAATGGVPGVIRSFRRRGKVAAIGPSGASGANGTHRGATEPASAVGEKGMTVDQLLSSAAPKLTVDQRLTACARAAAMDVAREPAEQPARPATTDQKLSSFKLLGGVGGSAVGEAAGSKKGSNVARAAAAGALAAGLTAKGGDGSTTASLGSSPSPGATPPAARAAAVVDEMRSAVANVRSVVTPLATVVSRVGRHTGAFGSPLRVAACVGVGAEGGPQGAVHGAAY